MENLTDIFRDFWEVKTKVDTQIQEDRWKQERQYTETPEILEQQTHKLDKFKGIQNQLIKKYRPHILYATRAIYRQPYSRFKKGIILRLNDDFIPTTLTGTNDELLPGIEFSFYGDDFTFSISGLCNSTVKYLEESSKKYIELGTNATNCLSTFAFLALSTGNLEPFYNVLIDFLSDLFPFDPGSIELAGYEDIVKMCENLITYNDPRTMKRHILLAGPPGCGKSMIIKQVAINHPEFVRFTLTRTRNWLTWINLFSKILEKCNKKVLVLIDEVDELGLSREKDGDSVYGLLRIMDGIENHRNLTLLASTNRLQDLDPALLRPGRFGPVIHVSEPTHEQVCKIIQFYSKRYACILEQEKIIASMHKGRTGADIRVAIEECMIHRQEITTHNVLEKLSLKSSTLSM